MSARHKKKASSSTTPKEAVAVTSDRVIRECMSAVSDAIKTQMEMFPQLTRKANLPPRNSSDDRRQLHSIPLEVKSSIRALSEDAWSVFQSVTSLAKSKGSFLDSPSHDDPSPSNPGGLDTNVAVATLKTHLGTMKSRLEELGPSEPSREDRAKGRQAKQGKRGNLGGKPNRSQEKLQTGPRAGQGGSVLERKVSSTYRAAQELGTSTGNTDSLRSLSKVLSQLDGLLAYIDSGYESSEQDVKETQLSEKKGGLLLSSGSDVANKAAELEKPSSSATANDHHSAGSTSSRERHSPQGARPKTKSPVRTASTDTRSETSKERKGKSPRRGKNTAEKQKASPGKTKTESGNDNFDPTTLVKLDLIYPPQPAPETYYDHTIFDSPELVRKRNKGPSPPKASLDLSQAGSQSGAPDDSSHELDPQDESLLGKKSKSDTGTSFDQNGKLGKESSGCENLLELSRRSSMTDLLACLQTTIAPVVSPEHPDMVPVSTTSCPDISCSPRTPAKHWPKFLASSSFLKFEHPNRIKMAAVLALVWIYVAIMAIFHVTTDISHAPFTEYADTIDRYLKHSLDIWYATEPWF